MSTGITFLAMSCLTNITSMIPWSSIFLFTPFFGIHLYCLKNKEICLRVQRKLKWSSYISDNDKRNGYAIGKWFILYIDIVQEEYGDKYDIWMISTESTYKNLIKEDTPSFFSADVSKDSPVESAKKEDTMLTIYSRCGTYYNTWYKKRNIPFNSIPRPEQKGVMDSILKDYKTRSYTVSYIHGPPGTGKSMIGPFLAVSLKGVYCNTLKPWQPGDSLSEIYAEMEISSEKPLILSFDEIDNALLKIHEGIPSHKTQLTCIQDKSGWNHFLDEISRGMYPYLILLLTSNKSPDWIRELDPSYIRENRVNCIFEMSEKIE